MSTQKGSNIEHIPIMDDDGFRKQIADLIRDHDTGNLEALVICVKRKDNSIRSYWNGQPEHVLVLNEVFKRDVIEARWPTDSSESIDFDELKE